MIIIRFFACVLAAGILSMIPASGRTENKDGTVQWGREAENKDVTVQWSREIDGKKIGISCPSAYVAYGIPLTFEFSMRHKDINLHLYHYSPQRTHHIQYLAFSICIRDTKGNIIRLHIPWPPGKKLIWKLPYRMILLDDKKNLWGIMEVIDQGMKIRVYLAPTQEDWSGFLWIEYVPNYWEHEKGLADKFRGLKSPEIKVAYQQKDKPSNKSDAVNGE
jgi:hypothetical protein